MEEQKSIVTNSIIGNGTSYRGEIDAVDLLRIDGDFNGDAKSTDLILVGEHGKVKGLLSAPRIIIAGMLSGKIEKCDLLILQSTAVIIGNFRPNNVIVESGALICGTLISKKSRNEVHVQMTDDGEKSISTSEQNEKTLRKVGIVSRKGLEKLFSI